MDFFFGIPFKFASLLPPPPPGHGSVHGYTYYNKNIIIYLILMKINKIFNVGIWSNRKHFNFNHSINKIFFRLDIHILHQLIIFKPTSYSNFNIFCRFHKYLEEVFNNFTFLQKKIGFLLVYKMFSSIAV